MTGLSPVAAFERLDGSVANRDGVSTVQAQPVVLQARSMRPVGDVPGLR